jgi:hypothetical protein
MMRIANISVLGVAVVFMASAGQIEIGAGQNGSGVSTQGLTVAFVNSVTQPTPGWAGEHAYAGTLFSSAIVNSSTLNGVAETSAVGTGTATTLPTSQNGFQQLTDNGFGVTFGMLADSENKCGSSGTGSCANDNFWASSTGTTGPTTITIPVSVSGVSEAYILLNDYWGVNGSTTQTDTVLFTFSGGTDTFTLTNGNQIEDAVQCLSATGTPNDFVGRSPQPSCTTFARSTSSPGTDNIWSGTYSGDNASSTDYFNTAGNLALNDISFNLSAFSGQTLKTISITDNNNGFTNFSSALALSAITVTGSSLVVVTPEPSTVLLLFAGLGVIVYLGQRRKARL